MAFHLSCLEALSREDGAQGFRADYPISGGMKPEAVNFFEYGAAAIAPLEGIRNGLKSALEHSEADGVELGLPAFGYVWNGSKALALDFERWVSLLKLYGPAQRDAASGELALSYQGHQACFVDSVAMLGKLLIARELGIDQVAIWALGSEDPRLWAMLEDFPVPFVKVKHGL